MSWKRLLRDGSIAVALCAALYFSANAIDGFVEPKDRVYSKDRQLADQYYADQDWEKASLHYRKLTEQDKYNGYAWFQIAVCQLGLRGQVVADIHAKQTSGASQDDLAKLALRKEEIEEEVIDSLVHASSFLRHRRRALVNLAIVYTGRRDWDSALSYLQTYIDEGNLLTRALEHISSLGVGGRSMVKESDEDDPNVGLHRFSEFWELVDLENRKRGLNNFPARSPSFLP